MIASPKPFRVLLKSKQPPEPKRLPERKPVSIAVGCQCGSRHIVLCADTLFTSPGNSKSYGCKLWYERGETEAWSVHFAYCGMKQFMDSFKEKFREVLAADQQALNAAGADSATTVPLLRDAISTTLTWLRADDRTSDATGVELLCAISASSKLSLYRTHGSIVSQVAEPCSVLGETPLSKYLVPLLAQPWPGWDVNHAVIAAAYIVKCAINYVDGCGVEPGTSPDMWVIRPNQEFIQLGSTIAIIDQRLSDLHYLAMQVSSTFASACTSADNFQSLIAQLSERLAEQHRELGQMISRALRFRQ